MQTVCLIGKPNVGKSTIFNRLIKEKKSIILDTPGVTRDRIYGTVNLKNKSFHLIDTGGLTLENGDFNKDILMQATLAIDEADIILFIVDAITEVSTEDKMVASMLHRSNKKVLVIVNKADNKQRNDNIYAFYELGFEDIIAVSAEHNIGFDKLNDYFEKNIVESKIDVDDTIKFCFVGRPNVGKSSLVNALLNEDRLIVSDVAGTTRDAVDSKFKYNGKTYTVIDTAGMRKKGKIYENIEKYSYIRSLKAIDRSDVCVLVIDAKEGIIEHDKHIASYIIDAGKAIVIAVNKWDEINNPDEEIKKWKLLIENEFQFLSYAKVVFISAKTKKRLGTLMPEIIKAYENHNRVISTSSINDVIMESVQMHNPPSFKGKRLKIYFTSQSATKPPKFTFEVNNKKLVHFSYARYLENQLRKSFDLEGTPIILEFKNKND
ncbi:MAG: ribosome biogenesis GTPase Der [bacterium]|nr:ribosome biogenesis GTPase Der [bacterium]